MKKSVSKESTEAKELSLKSWPPKTSINTALRERLPSLTMLMRPTPLLMTAPQLSTKGALLFIF